MDFIAYCLFLFIGMLAGAFCGLHAYRYLISRRAPSALAILGLLIP